MDEVNPLRVLAADLIAYGIVGSILEPAYEVLEEVDPDIAHDLYQIIDVVMTRFHRAETAIFELEELR